MGGDRFLNSCPSNELVGKKQKNKTKQKQKNTHNCLGPFSPGSREVGKTADLHNFLAEFDVGGHERQSSCCRADQGWVLLPGKQHHHLDPVVFSLAHLLHLMQDGKN